MTESDHADPEPLRWAGGEPAIRKLMDSFYVDSGGAVVPITEGEAVLRCEKREISILVAGEEVTITHARYPAGEQVAGPHLHHEYADAFYVLEELSRWARA